MVLIDGGAGPVERRTRRGDHELNLAVDDSRRFIGIAKGEERDAGLRNASSSPANRGFKLPHRAPRCSTYVQRLRDEAHRFAIGTHRTKRAIEMKKNPLDEIEGVGPGRKKALLHAFGSARGVSRASVDDLMKVEGVSGPLAERVWGYFRK